MKTDSFTACSQ